MSEFLFFLEIGQECSCLNDFAECCFAKMIKSLRSLVENHVAEDFNE